MSTRRPTWFHFLSAAFVLRAFGIAAAAALVVIAARRRRL
jgi:hypothetical protein